MKKPLLYFTLSVLIVTSFSCKKDSNDSDYYMKLKVDGTWITYNNVLAENGPDLGDPNLHDLVVNGYSSDQKDIFSIAIQDGAPIASGTYETDNGNYWAFLDWLTGANTADMRSFDIDDAPSMAPSKYIITITSITDNEIRGSFTGNYLYDDFANDPNDAVREVTEGEFVAKRID